MFTIPVMNKVFSFLQSNYLKIANYIKQCLFFIFYLHIILFSVHVAGATLKRFPTTPLVMIGSAINGKLTEIRRNRDRSLNENQSSHPELVNPHVSVD